MSDPIMDGYFIHTISHFLDHVDSLKCIAPVLGIGYEKCMEGTRRNIDREKLAMLSRIKQGEQSENAHNQNFPDEMSSIEKVTELLADYCLGMTIWAHPNAQANVVPPPTIPSITAFIAAAIYNPNLIWDEYSCMFAEAELEAVAMLSDLVGYDSKKSSGIFTFGGTGTILYGCKLGVEKIFSGRAMTEGVRDDVKIVASESSHYSRLNVAGWLGVGTKNVVTIPTTRENEMSLTDLEDYLRHAFETGEKVAIILATLGTTDTFGIDDLASIVRLRDKLAAEYRLEHLPHIHADAVIGWAWAVFKDYDFEINPLGFHARTLRSLQDSLQRISSLHMADSIGIDFHKTGYAPYISSAMLVKNRQDLILLSRAPEQMPYLYQYGYYHPGIYTLECSRPGTGALAALANMRLLGKQGYRVLLGHVVEMAEMLRDQLERHTFIKILNDYNYGPVTLFRVYPDGADAEEIFQRELTDPDYREQLEEYNTYNLRIFKQIHERAMRGEGILLSWTDACRHANYPDGPPVAALKSFIMSPWTNLKAVDMVARQVLEARMQAKK
ncbi:PLP-dependent enzyme, glutamate decarboxylase [Candidatus Methanoperedens nitroreducens]|uniref:PLP-dependent enzyme, glutamate decarboxylase n=2 Tax=Candidatus Methanoperedens nitratireducens TaxID=1392998 RepID=A0A062V1G2_9EURY|nr:PLP-dependent enzyme, glutamate decarboxylase [Candidatus Methanoperedens nitroreducens]